MSTDVNNLGMLAEGGKSETLEFKETAGTRREANMTICAFLNQDGGQVLVGLLLQKLMTGETRMVELHLSALAERTNTEAQAGLVYA